MSTLLPFRACLVLPLILIALGACSTQTELRMAAQQEQFAREAASQGDWAQAMRSYEAAVDNVELGRGDFAWQARLHHQAGRAASGACRYDAAEFHFRQAIALAKKSERSSALSYKALIDQYERQGKATEALAVRNELGWPQSWALGAFADRESLPTMAGRPNHEPCKASPTPAMN
ncbi:tetratricopeptide repeat protein [Janthinobacterium sp. SUN073]|uniref:tetratricopeptide repeat protein n=1 Tax=Janthinobacterium sp. SUN073 TaxID=3004102 RepID=UPI0025AF6F78|nr:tetratricopeptide repeat protein [Janthinobacterium sp. SUN073]MDN2698903.1 tetratricopeptide repeat protein [Janthinobacterium sp. SUN073]